MFIALPCNGCDKDKTERAISRASAENYNIKDRGETEEIQLKTTSPR
jgi:hypothetical protein